MQSKCNVLITGASGFVATHLAKKLVDEGVNVLCISRTEPLSQIESELCRYETLDLRNNSKLSGIVKSFNPDTIYHLASRADANENYAHAKNSIDDNLIGTINLLESFRDCDRSRVFVYGDSVKVYGNERPPYTQASLVAPNSSYAISKLAGWSFCELFARNNQFNAISVRPTLIYGQHQPMNLIQFVIQSILDQKTEISLMGGDQTRSPLYIADAISAYLKAAKIAQKENLKKMIISGDTEMKVVDIANLIKNILKAEINIIKQEDNVRETEISRSYVDLNETYEQFGWRPKYSLENGLREAIHLIQQALKEPSNKICGGFESFKKVGN